jgi:uncharacterized membrane protein
MDYYFWIKAAHVFAVFMFVGGMMLNGFLFLNLTPGAPQTAQIAAAARRWNGYVTGGALVLVWILGLTLAIMGDMFTHGWLSAKMVLVVGLSALHGFQAGAYRRMQSAPDRPVPALVRHSAAITAAFLAAIAILVIVQPF